MMLRPERPDLALGIMGDKVQAGSLEDTGEIAVKPVIAVQLLHGFTTAGEIGKTHRVGRDDWPRRADERAAQFHDQRLPGGGVHVLMFGFTAQNILRVFQDGVLKSAACAQEGFSRDSGMADGQQGSRSALIGAARGAPDSRLVVEHRVDGSGGDSGRVDPREVEARINVAAEAG